MSRWDDTSDAAKALIYEMGELDLAESLAEAHAALARVRELHRPVECYGRIICAACSAFDGQGSTDSPPVDHDQCDTLKALAGES
ncbi:hypothetical protein [Streptomyces zhihengii]